MRVRECVSRSGWWLLANRDCKACTSVFYCALRIYIKTVLLLNLLTLTPAWRTTNWNCHQKQYWDIESKWMTYKKKKEETTLRNLQIQRDTASPYVDLVFIKSPCGTTRRFCLSYLFKYNTGTGSPSHTIQIKNSVWQQKQHTRAP